MLSRREAAAAALMAASIPTLLGTAAHAQSVGESSFERIRRTKKFRCAGVVGAEPYFSKNLQTNAWSGFAIAMARDIAESLEAEVEITESTWGNSVLDLQANKIDVSFGLNPTPRRALVVDFTRPLFYTAFSAVLRKGVKATTWAELDDPAMTIAVDIGSTHELIARRMAKKAKIVGYKTQDEAILAVQAGRANCFIMTVILALAAKKKNAELGTFVIPTPVLSAPGAAALRNEQDKRLRDFLNSWTEYNRGMGQVRQWILESLEQMGLGPDDIPTEVTF